MTGQDQDWAEDAVDAAGGLDLLLTDAALGVTRRLGPTARCCGWPPRWLAARGWPAVRRPCSAPNSAGSRPAGP